MNDINYIDHVSPWKDNTYAITYIPKNTFFSWDLNHAVCLIDNQNKILGEFILPETRICFGVISIPEKNLFIYVHYKYNGDTPSVFIDFYNIDENFKFTLHDSFVIASVYSCNNVDGKICDNGNIFSIGFGDLSNYDYFDVITFNEYEHLPLVRIKNTEHEINHYYFFNDVILEPIVVAYDNEFLNIAIAKKGEENEFISAILDIKLQYKHKYDRNRDIDDVQILQNIVTNDNQFLFLLRVKLEYENFEVSLQLEEYYLDILFNATTNSVISISDKIRQTKHAFSGINKKEGNMWIKNVETLIDLL